MPPLYNLPFKRINNCVSSAINVIIKNNETQVVQFIEQKQWTASNNKNTPCFDCLKCNRWSLMLLYHKTLVLYESMFTLLFNHSFIHRIIYSVYCVLDKTINNNKNVN